MPGPAVVLPVIFVALAALTGYAVGRDGAAEAPAATAVAERALAPSTVSLAVPSVPTRLQPIATATVTATSTAAAPAATVTVAPRDSAAPPRNDAGTTIVEE